jgi:Zn-dependent protease with chaperone function
VNALDPVTVGASYAWRVALHSTVAGFVCYAWARHERLRPGRTKRWLLAMLIVLPLATAAVPGRDQPAFRDQVAWFDSTRVLALPLAGEVGVVHLVLLLALVTTAVVLVQEIVPALRHRRHDAGEAPPEVVALARALPGWARVVVHRVSEGAPLAAAGGTPRRPRLLLSSGLLALLDEEALAAVIRHEHAHAVPRRWWAMHVLFVARLLQIYSPVALWLFREYAVETEIACDRAAVAEGDARPLAGALLAVYDHTDPRDLGSRAVLRRRVDLLLGRDSASFATEPGPLGLFEVAAATLLLALLLPWIV